MEQSQTPEYWNKKGSTLGKERNFEEALYCFNQAIKMDKRYATAWYNKALCLKNLERYEKSLKAFDRAVQLNPNDPTMHRKREEVAIIVGGLAPARFQNRVFGSQVG